MPALLDWLLRLGADVGARNAARAVAERRCAQRTVDALAERLPAPSGTTRSTV